ncbi:MAG TPA: xanthine dehydrogenase family protein molybdopterin-binding subunit [Conexivisphaerales archaeon]|nr:xanthine dehydrogenase family protein molybdopterin-binding subunit [Conexivisphaerales archaeon]
METLHAVGVRTPRSDGASKATGSGVFAADVTLPGMLYGRIVRSPHARAVVESVDLSAAEKMGAICATYGDVPRQLFNPRLVSTEETTYKDWMVLSDRPNYVGEPVAVVAAETEQAAQEAAEAVKVMYRVLEPSFDSLESLKGDKVIHDSILLGDEKLKVENNVGCRMHVEQGDLAEGFAKADVVLEREYKTSRRYHAQLETKAVVCQPEPGGGMTIWCTTQTIHNTRILIHQIFGIPMNLINVKKTTLGGSFGSSIHTNILVPICVAISLKARRPVKIVYTREEDMHDHASFEMRFRIRAGAKKDGTFTACTLDMVMDMGAHQVQAYPLLSTVFGWWASFYKWSAFRYDGVAVYTNKVPSCAMRGYGNPQTSWAVESFVDEFAELLHMDPLELKLKNYVGLGDVFYGQGITVKSVIQSCGVEETLVRGAEMAGWRDRLPPGRKSGVLRRGLGMARSFHTSSAGSPTSGAVIDYTGAMVKVNEDGTVDVVTAIMDHGGGTYQALSKIAAEELGMPLENVSVVQSDTQTTVYDVSAHASRGVYAGGGAVLKVSKEVKEKLLSFAGKIMGEDPANLKIVPDLGLKQGVVLSQTHPEKRMTVGEVTSLARQRNMGSVAAIDSYRPTAGPPHFIAFFVEVEVDVETGVCRPIRVVSGADIGTVVNPDLAEGQIQGGFSMGWSMATLEDILYDPVTGDMANRGMLVDYKLPTAPDLPPNDDFKVFFAKTYEPTGPFGAKGMGEGSYNPVAGAVANAVYNAIGVRLYELPMTPERILAALRAKKGGA